MYLAKVYVTYKESILDPKGEAVKKAIHHMGYDSIQSVRIGKYFEIMVEDQDPTKVAAAIEEVSDKLLANVTMETYRYEIEEA
ncbi:phosphoribosylformylglycinamidine synthase subunit PurS [Vaginisenegalia massiliensis]|uniref:phosphoribosylformylglycinamidine synthase subunit PurS n=1 Tax=Vaginisenegalia massiliensis TaxID=2058294 RepID=UPI000F54B5FB|nr:phosphoribosylformylglycinamidine synthase subunit PurS [Vaginisenegalia massiliensis]